MNINTNNINNIWVKHLHKYRKRERKQVCVVVCCVLHCLNEATIYSGSRRQQ